MSKEIEIAKVKEELDQLVKEYEAERLEKAKMNKRNLGLVEEMIRIANQKEVNNFVVELLNNKTVIVPASKVKIDNFQRLVLFLEQDEIIAMYKLHDIKGFFKEHRGIEF